MRMNDEYAVAVERLVKKYKDLTAVDDISFNVKKGEFFAFLGPNGAGKTTTIKILCTLVRQTSGYAYINGYNTLTDPKEVRKSTGLFRPQASFSFRPIIILQVYLCIRIGL